VPATRYEILLPLRYNDGQDVELEKFLQTKEDLLRRFGALTVNPQPVEGDWIQEGIPYQDVLLKYVVDVEVDSQEVEEFFRTFKQLLKSRFRQLEIWIVASPIRII